MRRVRHYLITVEEVGVDQADALGITTQEPAEAEWFKRKVRQRWRPMAIKEREAAKASDDGPSG